MLCTGSLRRGLFMAKYIFPGADASMPLGWVVSRLEETGWEVQQVDTIGTHCKQRLRLIVLS